MITRRAKFDITVPMNQDMFSISFIKKEEIAKDTYMFSFTRPDHDFSFLPGQYISVYLASHDTNLFRDFSIASDPFDKARITIVTKKRISSYKDTLFHLEPGMIITVAKPAGGFVLQENNSAPKVFLAGGIGIVPLFSMFRYALYKKLTFPLTLIASFGSQQEILFIKELTAMAQKHPQARFAYTITGDDPAWSGEKGRISKEFVTQYIPQFTNVHYYLAGSPEFVVAMEDMLEGLQVPIANIKLEQFTGY